MSSTTQISPEKIYRKSKFFNLEKAEIAQETKTEIFDLSSLSKSAFGSIKPMNKLEKRNTEVLDLSKINTIEDIFEDKKNQTLGLRKKRSTNLERNHIKNGQTWKT